MGKRGRAAVEQFYNWKAEETKLLGLYTSLVGSPDGIEEASAQHPRTA